ncbi:membrane protein insertase YidC [Candidatus Falkowbacteria bacterium]|nr:membrane protein insertase YidC [Candidatus Falkowbacteria bacterium]
MSITMLYHLVLYKPIFNALIFLYNIIPGHSLILAITILTILIKLVLMPLSAYSLKSQRAIQELQPKLEELKKKFKDDKQALAKATMELYKESKVNPASSCLPLLIQFPFLIAVYQVFRSGLTNANFADLYSFVANPGAIDASFFGILNLSKPSVILAVITGLAQYVQTKMLTVKKAKPKVEGAKDENMLADMNKSMQYFMPFMTVLIGISFPAGLVYYWLLTTILTIVQQKIVFKKVLPPKA